MNKFIFSLMISVFLFPAVVDAQPPDADKIVAEAVAYYRGEGSVATVKMTIHRPDWERVMTIKAWTEGRKDSLFYIMEPPKDKGNGTLKRGNEMWTYNPKVNRVIKLPPSMMSQSWMGSDFSNNDLAKSDSILEDYIHELESVQSQDGMKVYIIKSTPKPAAPVVWGMQKLHIRQDHIMLREEYYDEELTLVKAMTGTDIEMLGGKLFPRVWKMQKADASKEYTRLEYLELEFTTDLPDRLFTIPSLKNPGR